MAFPYSLVTSAENTTHPALKPLVEKLGDFNRQFVVVDSHLRRFGMGYLHVANRWYEYFTAALGAECGETPEETSAAIVALDAEIAKLDELLDAARELATRLVPTLPQRQRDAMRTKLLILAITHAETLRSFIGEHRSAVAQKYATG